MTTPSKQSHLIVAAVLAALQIVNGGAALGDVIGPKWFGLLALIVAAFQAGWSTYVQGQTTSNDAVAAVKVGDTIVAGPSAKAADGSTVEVVPAAAG